MPRVHGGFLGVDCLMNSPASPLLGPSLVAQGVLRTVTDAVFRLLPYQYSELPSLMHTFHVVSCDFVRILTSQCMKSQGTLVFEVWLDGMLPYSSR
jgi:hypothetical protein